MIISATKMKENAGEFLVVEILLKNASYAFIQNKTTKKNL